METVTLKNGSIEAAPLVSVAMMSLTSLMNSEPIAFYELVMVCRNRNHQLFGNTQEKLEAYSLYPVHESIKNVVLSAVTGEGLNMTLGSPV